MAGPDIRKRFVTQAIYRGSQVVFGERKHLEEVLSSVQQAKLTRARKQSEVRQLKKLILARTRELNQINRAWDRKFKKARDPNSAARELLHLAKSLPKEDYLLARVLTEHPRAPGELLEHLAAHPYSAVRENVARHPHTPVRVLRRLAEDSTEPLWFLVAANPSTPPELRERLRERLREPAPE